MSHLLRAALLLVMLIAGIMAARTVSGRVSFELIGLYWGDNESEWASLDPRIGASEDCARCHGATFALWETSPHVGMPCSTCHGALPEHTETGQPVEQAAVSCELCHAQIPSRPASFTQVDPTQHEPQATCAACHNPHAPALAYPEVNHRLEGREDCTACHGALESAPLPPNHLDRPVQLCTGCHKPSKEPLW